MSEEFICKECGESFEEDYVWETEDGDYVCNDCADALYITCEFCEKLIPEDEATWWGDSRICPDCLDEKCPRFDRAENEDATEDAWRRLTDRFVGQKAADGHKGQDVVVEWGDSPQYLITVSVNDEGTITRLSRINAQMLLWEGETSSEWREYPVEDSDYDEGAVTAIEEEIVNGN